MATKFRIPFKNAVISSNAAPAAGTAGGKINDPLRSGGLNAVNLWGTATSVVGSGGIGVPNGYAMLALDGVIVTPVVVSVAALKENDPIYITAANVLNNVLTGNTLYGYADEPAAIGTVTLGVRISNAVGA
jgi:hypothetical protein